MESNITDIEWSEFIKVVTNVIETNPDPKFIETVAETLSVEIHSRYVVSIFDRSPFYKV